MKTTEREGANALSGTALNLTGNVKEVLKTLVLLEKSFGPSYLVAVLRGENAHEWKDAVHTQIETFGSLKELTEERVKNILHYMADLGLLAPVNVYATILGITEKGKQFLDQPWEITVASYKLRLQKLDYFLKTRLRNLRKRISLENKQAVYQVFSDWALERILRERPITLSELKKVAGITPHKAETFGESILLQVKEVENLRWQELLSRYEVQMKGQTAQEVKRLFIEGRNMPEIAAAMQLKVTTVSTYLERLHLCGQVNLKPFLERTMDSKTLYKGAEYFRKVQTPRLKEAYESLGLDYDTLRMCRLYVSDFTQKSEQVAVA